MDVNKTSSFLPLDHIVLTAQCSTGRLEQLMQPLTLFEVSIESRSSSIIYI